MSSKPYMFQSAYVVEKMAEGHQVLPGKRAASIPRKNVVQGQQSSLDKSHYMEEMYFAGVLRPVNPEPPYYPPYSKTTFTLKNE